MSRRRRAVTKSASFPKPSKIGRARRAPKPPPDAPALLRRALAECGPRERFSAEELLAAVPIYGPTGFSLSKTGLEVLLEVLEAVFASQPDLARLCSSAAAQFSAIDALAEIANRPGSDDLANWTAFKSSLRGRLLAQVAAKCDFAYPVWVRIAGTVERFKIGPVEFMRRLNWLADVRSTTPGTARWADDVERRWRAAASPFAPNWKRDGEFEERPDETAGEVLSAAGGAEWIAMVHVGGFERQEAARRADVAVRCALDVLRLRTSDRLMVGLPIDLLAAAEPDRLAAHPGDGAWRRSTLWSSGLGSLIGSGAPLDVASAAIRDAAGRRIETYMTPDRGSDRCPVLSDLWLYALHRFGRGCLEPLDYAAVEEFAFALDGLSGGNGQESIRIWARALLHVAPGEPGHWKGTPLKDVVEEVFNSRNDTVHANRMGFDAQLWSLRRKAQAFTAHLLELHLLALDAYANAGRVDEEPAFLAHLPGRAAAEPIAGAHGR